MHLRVRLILAFLLLSVVPLGAVTIYSYVANYRALQAAATGEADQLASELSQRMQLVTAQLSERVEHLMVLSAAQETPEPAPAPVVKAETKTKAAKPEAASTQANADMAAVVLKGQAADALGEAAMLLNAVELRGLRGPRGAFRGQAGSARGTPAVPGAPGPTFQRGPSVPGRSAEAPGETPAPVVSPPAPAAPPPPLMPMPPAAQPGESSGPPRNVRRYRVQPGGSVSPTPAVPAPAETQAAVPQPEGDRIQIDVGPIARDVFRQLVPEGTNPSALTPEQRQRIAAEINQRMTGINEGLKLAAAELQRKADETRKKAEADAKAAARSNQAKAAPPAPSAMKRRSALSGNRLNVTLEQNGKIVRTANAEVNLPNVLMTVFSSMPRGQGEVPFAVGRDGSLYTPTSADRAVLDELAPARLPNGASLFGEWVVVMTQDPTGSGLRLGIARPVGDSLAELRRTAGRNAALGLLFIGIAVALIVPLSGRLTRNLSRLTEAVQRFAHGDYETRVTVRSKDEIGELGTAFNQMAAEVEAHQRTLVDQERLKRELELGRQIQHDMQPQHPLRLGLTEIQAVSVPAREVGGDLFNYFTLPDGHVALVVGDVSGKGVGAALLMANIQASLRTRFALGQGLSAILDAVDRDLEANSPGQMYATLFVGILDPALRRLRYVNAGHHPQYVLRAGGGLERMSATGLPAGLLAGRGYSESQVQLQRGDLIFFYTDGCPETENDREEMFGTERLEALLVASGAAAPNDVLQRVEDAMKQFRGTREPFDDATMMAVMVG